MSTKAEKIALFIDGANLYATAKSLGFDIDYKRLLREFQSRGIVALRIRLRSTRRSSCANVASSGCARVGVKKFGARSLD